jgi:hypothetical protein
MPAELLELPEASVIMLPEAPPAEPVPPDAPPLATGLVLPVELPAALPDELRELAVDRRRDDGEEEEDEDWWEALTRSTSWPSIWVWPVAAALEPPMPAEPLEPDAPLLVMPLLPPRLFDEPELDGPELDEPAPDDAPAAPPPEPVFDMAPVPVGLPPILPELLPAPDPCPEDWAHAEAPAMPTATERTHAVRCLRIIKNSSSPIFKDQ